jgi:hypothetical protein
LRSTFSPAAPELAAVVRQAAEAYKHAIETNPEVARAYRRAKAALERDKARLEVRSE